MNKRKGCESGGQKRETQSERQVERQWFSVEERKSIFIFGVSPQAPRSESRERFCLSCDNFIQTNMQQRSFMTAC